MLMGTKVGALRILVSLTLNIIGVELGEEQCPFYHEFIRLRDMESCSWIHFEFLINTLSGICATLH